MHNRLNEQVKLFVHRLLPMIVLLHLRRTSAFQLITRNGSRRNWKSFPTAYPFFDERSINSQKFHRVSTAKHSTLANRDVEDSVADDDAIDPMVPFFPIFYNDVYEVVLPPNHRFPMQKYRQVRERVQARVEALTEEQQRLIQCEFRVSPLATVEELVTTHCPQYVENFLRGEQTEDEIRNVGFPWSQSGVKRALSSVGGTVAAATAVCNAMRTRREMNLSSGDGKGKNGDVAVIPYAPVWSAHVAGGTHHAFYDRGEGFCVFSDIAVAANVVLQRFPDVVKRILIIDLDVHQGNGNAVLFQGRDDVITFSMHCQSNYFSSKEHSDLDIELPENCTDETYLSTLNHWLNRIDEEGGSFDLVFFQAGVDIIQEDRLGRMSVTSRGVQRRNELVYDFAHRLGVPLVISMGGGYPRKEWGPILDAHASVYFQAHQYLSHIDKRENNNTSIVD